MYLIKRLKSIYIINKKSYYIKHNLINDMNVLLYFVQNTLTTATQKLFKIYTSNKNLQVNFDSLKILKNTSKALNFP